MSTSRIAVARALLFDRLVEKPPFAGGLVPTEPFRYLSREHLFASIRYEVQQILETRCDLTLAEAAGKSRVVPARSVINYGLPDFGASLGAGPQGYAWLALAAARAIEAYEPRLRNPRVQIDRLEEALGRTHLTVSAEIVVGRFREAVSFPVSATHRDPDGAGAGAAAGGAGGNR